MPNATVGGGLVGVERIVSIRNYQVQDLYNPFGGASYRCLKTEQGELNKFARLTEAEAASASR